MTATSDRPVRTQPWLHQRGHEVVKGQLDLPLGGQLISLLADSLFPCPRSADLLLI